MKLRGSPAGCALSQTLPLLLPRLKRECQQAADERYSMVLRLKSLGGWLQHTREQLYRDAASTALLGAAGQHYVNGLSRRALTAWRQYSGSVPVPHHRLSQRADSLRRRQQLLHAWQKWLSETLLHKRLRAGRRLAQRHHLGSLLRAWRQQAAGRRAVLAQVLQRFAGTQRQLLACALARWRLYLRLRLRKAAAQEVARAHCCQMLLRRSICSWAAVAQHGKQRRMQQAVQQRLQLMQVRRPTRAAGHVPLSCLASPKRQL